MSEAEAKLRALLAEDTPPARDAAFRVAAMERLIRRGLQRRLAIVLAGGVAVTFTIWAALPQLTQAAAVQGLPGATGAIALALCASAVGSTLLYLRRGS